MKLVKIKAENLKGCSFEQVLAPATFIVGPNFAGKTARADAVRLLLAGFLPELGKTNAATFQLSSGKKLSVAGWIDNGLANPDVSERVWTAKGDSVKAEAALGLAAFPKTSDGLYEVMLTAESWFGLTERDRVEWVFANVKESDLTPVLTVQNILTVALHELPAAARDKFTAELAEAIKDAQNEIGEYFDVREYVEQALLFAAEKVKEAKAYAIQMDKTVQGLSSLRAQDAAPVNVPEVEAKIAAINAEVQKLNETRADHSAAVKAEGKNASRRAELQKLLAGKAGIQAEKDRREADLNALRNRLNTVYARRDAYPELDGAEINQLREEATNATVALNGHRKDRDDLKLALERNVSELRDLESKTVCPYCGASGTGWKALKGAEIESTIAGIQSKTQTTAKLIGELAPHIDRLTAKIRAADSAQNERAGYQKEINVMIEQVRQAEAGIKGTESIINGYAANEGELAAIPLPNPSAGESIVTFDGWISRKRDALAELEQTRKIALGRAAEVKRLAEAEKGRDEAKTEQAVAETAAETLRELKAKMVAEVFNSLLSVANDFCGSLLKTPLAFNAAKSEVGTYRDGLWVSHRTFSGVERLMAYAGIQAAFASRAPLRVMVLDELGRAHGDVLKGLVEQCIRAVRNGMVDNFIGICPGEGFRFSIDNWKDEDCAVVEVL